MSRLPDFPGSHPIFQIEDVPNARDELCKVTIVMPWAVARQAIAIAAPFLDSIRRSVDTRTRNDLEQEERERRWARESQKRHQEARRALLRAIRRIPSGIDYHAFLCHCEGRESIHSWPAHSLYPLNITRRDLQRAYRRVRVTCACRWRARGQSVRDIANRLQCSEAVVREMLREKKGRPEPPVQVGGNLFPPLAGSQEEGHHHRAKEHHRFRRNGDAVLEREIRRNGH